jgi:hypothetical protein
MNQRTVPPLLYALSGAALLLFLFARLLGR